MFESQNGLFQPFQFRAHFRQSIFDVHHASDLAIPAGPFEDMVRPASYHWSFLPTNVCAYFGTDTDAKEVDYILAPDEGHGLHAQ